MTRPTYTLHHGDCLDVLRSMADASVDSVVTDPPYGLSFMGRNWDYDVPSVEVWAECLRVLKPGGHLLAFAGTRTQHRMACRIEDGGFEIRDMLAWLYGSGFPKSHNGEWGGTALKPALEPITMARKPLVGTVAANMLAHGTGGLNIDGCRVPLIDGEAPAGSGDRRGSAVYAQDEWTRTQMANGGNATPAAGRWPANLITDGSPEVVALFPATTSGGGNKNTSNRDDRNAYGKGLGKGKGRGIGGDTGSAARFFYCAQQDDSLPRKGCYNAACQDQNPTPSGAATAASSLSLQSLLDATVQSAAATWPSLGGILSSGSTEPSTIATPTESRLIGEAVTSAILPIAFESLRESLQEKHSPCGSRVSVAATRSQTGTTTITASLFRSDGSVARATSSITPTSLDLGGPASRFRYCAKASKRDREDGLDGFELSRRNGEDYRRKINTSSGNPRGDLPRANLHPTVKPTDLMRYLCRLVTPPGGIVLDPFTGSGSTGKAAILEGFRFIGAEREAEYIAIARARIEAAMPADQLELQP